MSIFYKNISSILFLVILLFITESKISKALSTSVNKNGINPFQPDAWQVEGGKGKINFGYSVASAGDVNGDGYSDIIVGARRYSNKHLNEGKVLVWYGTSTDKDKKPPVKLKNKPENLKYSTEEPNLKPKISFTNSCDESILPRLLKIVSLMLVSLLIIILEKTIQRILASFIGVLILSTIIYFKSCQIDVIISTTILILTIIISAYLEFKKNRNQKSIAENILPKQDNYTETEITASDNKDKESV